METATLEHTDIDEIGIRLARLMSSESWVYDPLVQKVLFVHAGGSPGFVRRPRRRRAIPSEPRQ